jgi:hypothetical protein
MLRRWARRARTASGCCASHPAAAARPTSTSCWCGLNAATTVHRVWGPVSGSSSIRLPALLAHVLPCTASMLPVPLCRNVHGHQCQEDRSCQRSSLKHGVRNGADAIAAASKTLKSAAGHLLGGRVAVRGALWRWHLAAPWCLPPCAISVATLPAAIQLSQEGSEGEFQKQLTPGQVYEGKYIYKDKYVARAAPCCFESARMMLLYTLWRLRSVTERRCFALSICYCM